MKRNLDLDTLGKTSATEFWAKVHRARSMTPEEKIAECCLLTDMAFEAMKEEIRADYPRATEEQVIEILNLRMDVLRIVKGKLPAGAPEESHSPPATSASQ